jgi:F-type H+-transporting ATPase subunit epsilon
MPKLHLTIATPHKLFVQDDVDEVIAPGAQGYFGVLPAHTAFLTELRAGDISYRIDDKKHILWISGGYCEVLDENVTILAHKAKSQAESKKTEKEAAEKS